MSQTKAQLVDAVDGSIVAADLAADCVTTAKVANSAITDAKISALTSSKLTGALPAISGASLTNLPASGKATNLIINGAMQVAQRTLAIPVTSNTTNGFGSVDRFRVFFTGTDESPTQEQADVASGTTPYTLGFRRCLKVTNGNQTSGAGSSDYIIIRQTIENQDIAQSGWNYTSTSSYVTLSFWVKSSVAQNFYGNLWTQEGTDYNYIFETGSLSADTWTKITKTVPGNSNLQFPNDNNAGIRIQLVPFYGTDKTGSVSLNTWAVYDGNTIQPDNTSTWYTTNDATLEITGVLLEVGDSASDYPHETYAETLTKCSRYFQQCRQNIYGMTQDTNARVLWVYPLKGEMRVQPSVTATSTSYRFGNQVNAAHGVSSFSINRSGYGDNKTIDFAPTRSGSGSSTTTFDMQFLEPTAGTDATFQFSAEF